MGEEAALSETPLIRRHQPPGEQSERSDSRTKCSMEHWREQFRCSSFGLEYPHPHVFTKFEWGWPKVYLCWRGVAAVYHVAVIIVSGFCDRYTWTRSDKDSVKWFIYLTNWMFFLLTLSTIVHLMAVGYCHIVRKDIISGGIQRMPVFLKVTWVLQNLSNTISILVTILFWGYVRSPGKTVSNVDFITHTLNTTYVIINLCISAFPVRFLHFFHPLIVAATYTIFSVLYQTAGGTDGLGAGSIYHGLDWATDPGSTTLFYCTFTFIGVPAIQFVTVLIAMGRGTLFDVCMGRSRHCGLGSSGYTPQ